MSIAFMTRSKKLACASADRMITFYDLTQGKQHQGTPYSRIENLVGVPHCMDYFDWSTKNTPGESSKKKDTKDVEVLETLLVGDDLGIIHRYNFTSNDWHFCEGRNWHYLEEVKQKNDPKNSK